MDHAVAPPRSLLPHTTVPSRCLPGAWSPAASASQQDTPVRDDIYVRSRRSPRVEHIRVRGQGWCGAQERRKRMDLPSAIPATRGGGGAGTSRPPYCLGIQTGYDVRRKARADAVRIEEGGGKLNRIACAIERKLKCPAQRCVSGRSKLVKRVFRLLSDLISIAPTLVTSVRYDAVSHIFHLIHKVRIVA